MRGGGSTPVVVRDTVPVVISASRGEGVGKGCARSFEVMGCRKKSARCVSLQDSKFALSPREHSQSQSVPLCIPMRIRWVQQPRAWCRGHIK